MATRRSVTFESKEEGRNLAIDSAIDKAVQLAMDHPSQPLIASPGRNQTVGVEHGCISTSGALPVDMLQELVRSVMHEQHLDVKQTLHSWEIRQEALMCRLEKMLPALTDVSTVFVAGAEVANIVPAATPIGTPLATPAGTPVSSDLFEKCPANFSKAMKPEPVSPANGDQSMPVPDGLEAAHSTLPRSNTDRTSYSRPSTNTRPSYRTSTSSKIVLEHGWSGVVKEWSAESADCHSSVEESSRPVLMHSKSRDIFKIENKSIGPIRLSSMRKNSSQRDEDVQKTFSMQEREKQFKMSKAAAVHQRLSHGSSIDEDIEILEDGQDIYSGVVKPFFSYLANSRWFEYLSTLVIVTNALFIGAQVEYMALERTDTTPSAFLIVQIVYVFLFTFELIVRLLAEGSGCMWGENWTWNIMDIATLGISILELGLEASSQASVVRLIRVVRIVRIVRIIRTVRFYRALRLLVYSIFGTLRQLGWTLVLLVTIMYMFGIVFTQAATEHLIHAEVPGDAVCNEGESSPACTKLLVSKYFGTLARTMFSLFKTICGGVDWEGVVDPLSDLHWFYVALFVTFVAFMVFAVLNVVIGVFCNSAIENAHKDQEAVIAEHIASKQLYIKNLRKLFRNMESLKFGVITLEDLENCIKSESLSAWFAALELDVSDAWTLFKLIDVNEKNVIGVEDFVEGCLRLRGTARSIDLARMMYENRWMMNKLVRLADDMDRSFSQVTHGHQLLLDALETIGRSFGIALPRSQLLDEFGNYVTQSTTKRTSQSQ